MTAMVLEQLYGHVTAMTRKTDGSTVTVAAAIADTVITVESTGDFDADFGGQVVLGPDDDVYDYTSVDEDASTITLATGLLTALDVDDRVDIYDPEVQGRIVDYVALVLLDEQDPGDEPIEVTVQHGLVNMLDESVRGGIAEAVTLVHDGPDDYMIWQIDGKLAVDVALEAAVSDLNVSIDELLESAALALNLAEASNAVFRQTTAPDPSSVTLRVNDTWFDTDDSNRPYRWDGSAWVDATQSWLKTNPTSTYPNVVISPAGLVAYSAGGVAVTTISSADGTITTTGSLWTGGDISGATVTGSTVQSIATANRGVKFNSSGFVAYDAAGTPTFVITGSTGAVTMKGALTAGSTITGGSLTTSGSIPITISGAGIGWTSGAAISETGTDLTIQRGSSAITLSSSGIDMFGSVDASGTFSGTHAGTHSGSWSGGMTASGAVHGSTIFADSVPTTGAAINAVMGGSGQFLMNTSSRRYKFDEEPYELDIAQLAMLQPKRFRRYDDDDYDEANPHEGRWYYGVIAEDAQDLGFDPWLIFDAENTLQSFDYPGFATAGVLFLARALAEALTRIDDLEAR